MVLLPFPAPVIGSRWDERLQTPLPSPPFPTHTANTVFLLPACPLSACIPLKEEEHLPFHGLPAVVSSYLPFQFWFRSTFYLPGRCHPHPFAAAVSPLTCHLITVHPAVPAGQLPPRIRCKPRHTRSFLLPPLGQHLPDRLTYCLPLQH